VEGRRRRAQRLTQNTQEEAENPEIRQQAAPERKDTVSSDHSVQDDERGTHTRRRQKQETFQEPAHERNGRKRLSAPKARRGETFRHAAQKAEKSRKKLLRGLNALRIPAFEAANEGRKKLDKAAGKMLGGLKRHQQTRQSVPHESAAQEYELTPVRPEDYRGRGKAHAQQAAGTHRHHKTKISAKNAQIINRIASIALICVALFSAWQIGSILLRSLRTMLLNEELSQQRAAIIKEQQDIPAPESEYQPAITAAETQEAPAQEAQPAMPAATAAPDIVKTMKYRGVGGEALPEMAALYEKNSDLVAWIQIPEVLDLPIVYRNNDYYLTRDFNKQKNASGTIFLDVNHPFRERTQNLLLHGHNMKDGTMFGHLVQYLHDDTYLRYHPFIYFDTLWHKEQYVIFAVLNVSLDPKDERFFNYFTHDTFSSDKEFAAYIRQLQLRSQYAIPIDVTPSDALLTLSTCLEEDRLVIVARRLREGETRSDLRALIRMATRQ